MVPEIIRIIPGPVNGKKPRLSRVKKNYKTWAILASITFLRVLAKVWREWLCISSKKSWPCLKLQLHDAIYRLQFYSNSLIHILSLSNSHNNVASIQKNRGDKSHCVIVALERKKGQKRFFGYIVRAVVIEHYLHKRITANVRLEWSQYRTCMTFQSASFRKVLFIPEILIQKNWKVGTTMENCQRVDFVLHL